MPCETGPLSHHAATGSISIIVWEVVAWEMGGAMITWDQRCACVGLSVAGLSESARRAQARPRAHGTSVACSMWHLQSTM